MWDTINPYDIALDSAYVAQYEVLCTCIKSITSLTCAVHGTSPDAQRYAAQHMLCHDVAPDELMRHADEITLDTSSELCIPHSTLVSVHTLVLQCTLI